MDWNIQESSVWEVVMMEEHRVKIAHCVIRYAVHTAFSANQASHHPKNMDVYFSSIVFYYDWHLIVSLLWEINNFSRIVLPKISWNMWSEVLSILVKFVQLLIYCFLSCINVHAFIVVPPEYVLQGILVILFKFEDL